MANRYVSNSESNDYRLGVDSGDGLTKATAWLTITYALANSDPDDVITVNDGAYTENFSITQPITLQADNYGAVTVNKTATMSCFNTTGGTINLNGIIVDMGGVTANAININNQTTPFTVNMTEVHVKEFTRRGINVLEPELIGTFTDIAATVSASTTMSGTGADAFRNATLTTGSITIDGFDCNIDTAVAGSGAINIEAAGAGGSVSIKRLTGRTVNSSGECWGARVFNVKGASIDDCNYDIDGTGTTYLYRVAGAPSLTAFDSTGCRIANNSGTNRNSTGYLILVGSDASSNGDNLCDAHVFGNNVTGVSGSEIGHGIMVGHQLASRVEGNTIAYAVIGTIAKETADDVIIAGNTIKNVPDAGSMLRAKGATNSKFSNNTLIMTTGYAGKAILADRNDTTGTDSTGCEYKNNSIYTDATVTRFAEVSSTATVANTATFSLNNYYSTAALPAAAWNYQGTTYATLTLWKAAQESDATDADPLMVDVDSGDYSLTQSSPLVGSGAPWWGTGPRPQGSDGEPFSDNACDIGGIQSTWSLFHPMNL